MKLHLITTEQLKAVIGNRDKTVELLAHYVEDLGAVIALTAMTDRANDAFLALALERIASRNTEIRAEIAKLEGEIYGQH